MRSVFNCICAVLKVLSFQERVGEAGVRSGSKALPFMHSSRSDLVGTDRLFLVFSFCGTTSFSRCLQAMLLWPSK
jgi:hypothetical protein